ncbi:MAG: hypothetical protein AAB377_00200 [Patescibacteria group bacterium]
MENLITKKKHHFRFYFVLGGFFLFFIVLIGLFYFILRSPWLKVQNFDVPNLPGISREEIFDSLKTRMLEGKFRAMVGPENILFWEFGKYPDSLYRIPAVKDLKVETDFWKHSVKISAGERQLWGVVCDENNLSCFGLDENGVIFSKVPSVSGFLILKISDINKRFFFPGQGLFSRPEWFANLKQSIEVLNRNGLKVVSAEIGDLSLREWTARTAKGSNFYFSLNFSPENLDSVLKNLKKEINVGAAGYIDLRVPNRIYYK